MRLSICTLVTCLLAVTASAASDPASTLARILAEKGTISAAELSQVESAAAGERVDRLAAILQQKGILTGAEFARLSAGESTGPAAAVVAGAGTSGVVAGSPPAKTRQTSSVPAVVAQSKVPVTIYGTLLLSSFYNTAGTNNQDIPLFTTKQSSDPSGGDKNFGMTARQSRFGLRYQGTQVGSANLSGLFEVDLMGGKAGFANGIDMDMFRLRLAYGRMDWQKFSIEAGQDWSVFSPLNPTTLAEYGIPGFSASGNLWIRTPQLRAEYRSSMSDSSRVLWQIAAADPNIGDYSTTTFASLRTPSIGERGRMPALDARTGWTTRYDDREFTLGLSAHYGRGKNFGTVAGQNVQTAVDSWGVSLDYTLPVTHFLVFTGEAFTGRALGIFSATSGEVVLPPGTPGEHGVEARGGWAQAQVNFNSRWQANLAYGLEVPNAGQLPVGNRSKNRTYMGNIMFKVSPAVTLAWEYRRLLTDFRNQSFANERGDHVNLGVAFAF